MNADSTNFPDAPQTFKPERWLKPGAEQRRYHAFGYGRRICPGRHIAENSVFVVMAKVLWGSNAEAVGGKPDDKA